MTQDNAGWTFTDQAAVEWQPLGPGVAMKSMGVADGKIMALFHFDAAYEGGIWSDRQPTVSPRIAA